MSARPPEPAFPSRETRDAGFSLIELIATVALAAIVLGISAGFYPQAVQVVRGDADLRIVYWELKGARDTAITQRRTVEVQFTAPNIITVVRRNMPAGTTVLSTAVLEHNMRFLLFAGQPDTPDAFGRAAAVDFGGANPILFTPDGMLTDNLGNAINGTVFLGQPGRPITSRALTVFGPTSTIRTYRWNGGQWRQ
jgi:prepilin-type N-terminal cleavage/methylation domain-containing protein